MPVHLFKDIFKTPKEVRFVEKRGYNLNASIHEPHPQTGSFLIHQAAKRDKVKIVAALIKAGVDINLSAAQLGKSYGQTPLSIAVWKGNKKTISFLIQEKADVEKCDAMGEFPLIKAARKGDAESLKHLLDAGAEINQENLLNPYFDNRNLPYKHMTGLMHALQNCMSNCAMLFLEYGAETTNSQGVEALIYCDYNKVREKIRAEIEERRSNIEKQYRILTRTLFLGSEIIKLVCGYTHGCNHNSSFFKFTPQKHKLSLSGSTGVESIILEENPSSYYKKRRIKHDSV
jgi:hypothetical protein